MQEYKTPKGIVGRFVKFERWMMYGNNMYHLVGVIGFLYIAIEALAMGTNVLVDETGQVRDGYTNFILAVDISKTLYLATVEFIFITMFAVVVSRAKSDGWQFRDILPIGTALIVMSCITLLVLSVYLVSQGYITIGGPSATYFTGWLDKEVIGRDYNTFVVICLSLVVAIVRAFFERGTAHAEVVEKMREDVSEDDDDDDDKSSSSTKSKVRNMRSKRRAAKEAENDDDKVEDDDEVVSIINPEWWDEPTAKTMEKLFQRVTSKDNPKPSLKIVRMDDKVKEDFESALEFISDEGETANGISNENEEIAARVVAESWGVLESKDTIRNHKEVAQKFSK